ncbi:MAG TPA: SpoIID/LytB domain-containing protein [Bacillota bacterium]|nr:SpoIID/LytB domain-containing protein [Bacillota bacterium]HOA34899.1 SpoIID/LytB domain-containing protein [Bacillota bacterium]HOJ84187.1 SpoIID/LytB domain-containing protein [Bacillota bacterium]HOL14609.1 SpoIID/LytB domain-containing protein [Bacillota bacterium]HPZ10761.1 SpoIID/LytB domain-containing protein [Bacillota bacterium]
MSRLLQINLLLLLCIALIVSSGCRRRKEAEPPPLPEALKEYQGREPRLKVYQHESGAVTEMDFEDYIAGVVAAEMDPQWPESALGAQAIIARTFTLQKIKENGGLPDRNAHASTDFKEFQAYSAARINERVRKAVEKTRGKVALYEGDYIKGWFHAYAGPRTALPDEGLEYKGENPPYIQIVDSPAEKIIPAEEKNWSASFSLAQVQAAVQEAGGEDPGPVQSAEISEKGPSGRATKIKINEVEVSAPSLRLALGSTEMRSTFIEEIELGEGGLYMAGTGYGHGVGMCQWGARALAEEGQSPDEIVNYFYRDITLAKAW